MARVFLLEGKEENQLWQTIYPYLVTNNPKNNPYFVT